MDVHEELTAKDVQALRLELQQLRNDFAAMGRTLSDIAGHFGDDAYQRVRHGAERARAQAEKAAETVTHTIEERPFTSVVTAFVVGLLMGVLFGRQR